MTINNKWTKWAAAAIMAGGLLAPGMASAAAVSFSDIENSYAKDSILALAELGVLNGVGGDKFNPGGLMTREQFAKILVLGGALEATEESLYFGDNVNKSAWYYDYVQTIAQNGIMKGDGYGSFGVGQALTREAAVVSIVRSLGLESMVDPNAKATFTDADQISAWAQPHVALVEKLGIINGMGDGTFAPKVTTTREMAAKMLFGAVENSAVVGFAGELGGFVAGVETEFSLSTIAKNFSQDVSLRYRATITDSEGVALANQEIEYEVADGVWQVITTDENGVVFFGPAEGFKTEDIGLDAGVTTKFLTTVANAGDYVLNLALVNVADNAVVAEGTLAFTVAAAAAEEPATTEEPTTTEPTTTEPTTTVVE